MKREPYAWVTSSRFLFALPASPIQEIGHGAPPESLATLALESALDVEPSSGPLRYLRLRWSDGATMAMSFIGSVRFGAVTEGSIRPLGPFLAGLRDVLGARGVIAISESELAFVLDPRALFALTQARLP